MGETLSRPRDWSKITRVEEGEPIRFNGIGGWLALGACDSKDTGFWGCLTHGISFSNQLEKDSHVRRGEHRLFWVCKLHGPEVP